MSNIIINLYFTRHGYACNNLLRDSSTNITDSKSTFINTRIPNAPLTNIGIIRSYNIGKKLFDNNIIPNKFVLLSSPVTRAILTAYYQYHIFSKKTINIFPYVNETLNPIEKILGKSENFGSNMFSFDFENYKSKYQHIYDYLRIDNKIINIDNDYHNMILDGETNLDPNYFLRCLLANLDKYKEEGLDEVNNEFNFIITSHGNYIKNILKYFSKDYPILEVINNEVFKIKIELSRSIFIDLDIDYKIKINCILHSNLQNLIVKSLITRLTYFTPLKI